MDALPSNFHKNHITKWILVFMEIANAENQKPRKLMLMFFSPNRKNLEMQKYSSIGYFIVSTAKTHREYITVKTRTPVQFFPLMHPKKILNDFKDQQDYPEKSDIFFSYLA